MSYDNKGFPQQTQGAPPPQYAPQYNNPQQYSSPGYNYTQNQSNLTVVAAQPTTVSQAVFVDDYMNRAIIATLCCFWPIGIFAIMKSSECRNALNRGDIATAQTHANSARQLSNIAIIVGACSLVVVVIIVGVYYGALISSYN